MSFFENLVLFVTIAILVVLTVAVGVICIKCVSTIIRFFDYEEENKNGK